MVKRQREPGTIEQIAQRIQTRTIVQEIRDNQLETEYKTAIVSTSLARHLCEHMEHLPIGAQTRILDTHDYLQMMIPLVDEPPWTRRRARTCKSKEQSPESTGNAMGTTLVWEKLYNNSEWKEVEIGRASCRERV